MPQIYCQIPTHHHRDVHTRVHEHVYSQLGDHPRCVCRYMYIVCVCLLPHTEGLHGNVAGQSPCYPHTESEKGNNILLLTRCTSQNSEHKVFSYQTVSWCFPLVDQIRIEYLVNEVKQHPYSETHLFVHGIHTCMPCTYIELVSLHYLRWRVVSIIVGLIVLVPLKALQATHTHYIKSHISTHAQTYSVNSIQEPWFPWTILVFPYKILWNKYPKQRRHGPCLLLTWSPSDTSELKLYSSCAIPSLPTFLTISTSL